MFYKKKYYPVNRTYNTTDVNICIQCLHVFRDIHCTENEVFHLGFLQLMWLNPQKTANLITLTEEIFNGNLHLLCSDMCDFAICGTSNDTTNNPITSIRDISHTAFAKYSWNLRCFGEIRCFIQDIHVMFVE